MIKFSDLQAGDYVLAESDGQAYQGKVLDFNKDEKEICVYNGVQDFWFKGQNLYEIPLDEVQLFKLKFSKAENEDGSVKYMKGAFRLQTPKQDDFSNFIIWYRDEKRVIQKHIAVHELQHHYSEMTKVHLTDEII